MSIAERRLSNKIRMFEDMLLRSKNNYEIETLRNELAKMHYKKCDMQRSPNTGSFLFTLKSHRLLWNLFESKGEKEYGRSENRI